MAIILLSSRPQEVGHLALKKATLLLVATLSPLNQIMSHQLEDQAGFMKYKSLTGI